MCTGENEQCRNDHECCSKKCEGGHCRKLLSYYVVVNMTNHLPQYLLLFQFKTVVEKLGVNAQMLVSVVADIAVKEHAGNVVSNESIKYLSAQIFLKWQLRYKICSSLNGFYLF